jgi:predicted RNA-binding protein Jag
MSVAVDTGPPGRYLSGSDSGEEPGREIGAHGSVILAIDLVRENAATALQSAREIMRRVGVDSRGTQS